MTLLDNTAPAQTETISFEFEFAHAPEKVWRALTDPALLSEWLLPVIGLKLEVGAPFTLKTQPYPPWDGTVDCKMLAIEPHKKISYAWDVGAMGLQTVVTFTLTKTEKGTRMSLVQSGFKPEQKQNSGGARYGWKLMGQKLIDLLSKLD